MTENGRQMTEEGCGFSPWSKEIKSLKYLKEGIDLRQLVDYNGEVVYLVD